MPIKTTHLLLGYAVVAGAAALVVVPAIAQDSAQITIQSSATATPNKAGTPAHPRGLSIRAAARLVFPADMDPPVVTAIEIRTAPGIDWHGEHYVTCRKAVLDRGGPRACPPRSVMGTAVATGHADTVAARLKVVFLNGGAHTTYAYATLNRPARVRTTLVVHSTRFNGGPWGHMEAVKIPRLLQVVAGIPLALNRVTMDIGGKPYAKNYISSTGCPGGGWKYQVTAHTTSGGQTATNVGTGRISCTK